MMRTFKFLILWGGLLSSLHVSGVGSNYCDSDCQSYVIDGEVYEDSGYLHTKKKFKIKRSSDYRSAFSKLDIEARYAFLVYMFQQKHNILNTPCFEYYVDGKLNGMSTLNKQVSENVLTVIFTVKKDNIVLGSSYYSDKCK